MGFRKQLLGFYGEPTACVWPASLINIWPLTSGGNCAHRCPKWGRRSRKSRCLSFPTLPGEALGAPVSLLGAELCQSWAVSGCQLLQPVETPLSGRSMACFSVQVPRRRRSSRFRDRETHICVRFIQASQAALGGKDSASQCRSHRRLGFNPWCGMIHWRRKWEPTLVFLFGKSHEQRSLVGYGPWKQSE